MKSVLTLLAAVFSTLFLSSTSASGQVLLSEVYYDHPDGPDDGFEWVELVNLGDSPVDLSSWSLGWGGVNYTYGTLQLSGSIPAAGTFVVGGPTSEAGNGNPSFDLTADFDPDIQNSGAAADGVALFNVAASSIDPGTIPVDTVIYGSANTNGLIDETGSVGDVDVADVVNGWSIERIDAAGSWQEQSVPSPGVSAVDPPATLLISEVLYDLEGGPDDTYEWVELVNVGSAPVNLAGWSLGWGGLNYTYGKLQLAGIVPPGGTFVVGGPASTALNFSPTLDQAIDFNPDLQNAGTASDGLALFNQPASAVTTAAVPIDVVIYGSPNSNGLIDETGAVGTPDVGDAPNGQSIERTTLDGDWQIQSTPTPGSSDLASVSPILAFRIISADSTTGLVNFEVELASPATVSIDWTPDLPGINWENKFLDPLPAGVSPVQISFPSFPDRAFFRILEVSP